MYPSHPCLGLVSDEPASGSLLVDALTDLNYPIVSVIPVTAHTLSILRAAQPAAILIDMGARGNDALRTLLDALQQDDVLSGVPLMALLYDSPLMAPDHVHLAYRGIAVVQKPFVLQVLLNQVQTAVRAIRHVPALASQTPICPELRHVLA